MRTLVVLAVMVAVSARQASSMPTYGTQTYGYGQPRYVGPLASSVPAGVDGRIIPVSDTYEVAAAKDQFFRAYQNQLNTIYAIRASRPHYQDVHGQGTYGSAGPVHVSHAVHAPAVHVSHSSYNSGVYGHPFTHGVH